MTTPQSLVSKCGFALIVGVSRYRKKRAWTYVPNALPDSKAIAKVLENLYHFTPLLLTDNKATKERIISVLKYIQQNSIKASKFIFVFTGKIESGQLCCFNYHRKKRNTTAISLKSLDDRISRIYGRDKLLIVNAKYSSKLFEDIQSADLLCSQNIKEKLWLENGSGIFMSKLCSVLNYQTVKDLFSILDLMDVLGAFLPREYEKDGIREEGDPYKEEEEKSKEEEEKTKEEIEGKIDDKDKGEHLFHPILACRDEENPFFFSRKTQQRFENQAKSEEKKKKKKPGLSNDNTVLEPFDDDNRFRSATLVDLPKLSGYTLLRSKLINSIVHDLCSAELSEEDKSERATILRSISMSLLTVEEELTQEKPSDKRIVVLVGQKGFGKSMTVNIVAHNPEVRKSFDFVFYFDMGVDGDAIRHLVKCQRKVIMEFTKEEDYFDTIEQGRAVMKKFFDLLRPKVLIILDDVKDRQAFEAFHIHNKNLKILITAEPTTNLFSLFRGQKKDERSEYMIGEMNEFDCIVLFSEVLQIESFRIQGKISEGLGPVRRLFDLCKHQPLCLSLVANILFHVKMDEWDFRVRSIQAVEAPHSDRKYFSIRHQFLYQTIYFLVEDMEEMKKKEGLSVVERQLYDSFMSFALIPNPSIWIPITIVKFYMGDESVEHTYLKVKALNKIGLLRIEYYENELCVNLHEIVYNVVRGRTRKDYTDKQIKFLRRLVLCTYATAEQDDLKGVFLNNARWYQWKDRTTLAYDDNYSNMRSVLGRPYVLQYISHHLSEGKTTNRCIEGLLLSIDWYTNVHRHFKSYDTIIDDFYNLEGFPYNITHREFTFLYHAFKLSLPIIHSRFQELKQQFIGRLSTIKFDKLRLLVNRLRAQMHGKLYPYSRYSGLEVPSAKRFGWLGHTGKIDSMDVSIDSMTVVTLSKEDKTAVFWDLGGEKPGSVKDRLDLSSFHEPCKEDMVQISFVRCGINNSVIIVLDDCVYRKLLEEKKFHLKHRCEDEILITAFATSEDNYFFIIATTKKQISFHAVASGNTLMTIPTDNIVTSITLFGAGTHICYGDAGGQIVVFQTENKKEMARWSPHSGFCINRLCVGFEKYVFSCASDRKIIMSDWNSDFQREFEGHMDAVTELILSVHNDWLVSTGWDGRIILWDVVSGRKISQFVEKDGMVECLRVTPNRKWILSTHGPKLSCWDFKLKREDRVQGEGGRVTSNVVLYKNQRWVIYGTSDGRVRVRDIDTLEEVFSFSHSKSQRVTSHNPVVFVAVTSRNPQPRSMDEEFVFGVYKNDEWVRVWRLSTGELEDRVNPFGETLWNIFWWRSNLVISSGGIWPNEEVRVWDIRSGITKEVLLRNRKVFEITVSRGGKKNNAPYVICKNIYAKKKGYHPKLGPIEAQSARRGSNMSKSMASLVMPMQSRIRRKGRRGGNTNLKRIKSDMGSLGDLTSSRSLTSSKSLKNLNRGGGKKGLVRTRSGGMKKLSRMASLGSISKPSSPTKMKRVTSAKFLTPKPRKLNPDSIFSQQGPANVSRAQTKRTKDGLVVASSSTYTKKKKRRRRVTQTALPAYSPSQDIFGGGSEGTGNEGQDKMRLGGPRGRILRAKRGKHKRTKSDSNTKSLLNIAEFRKNSPNSQRKVRHLADVFSGADGGIDMSSLNEEVEGEDDVDIKTTRVDHQFTVINLETQMVVSVPYPSRNKLSQIVVNKSGKSHLFGYMGEKVLMFSLETVSEDVVLFCTEERRKYKKANCISNIQCSDDGMYLVVVFDNNIISLYHNENTTGGHQYEKKSTYTVKEKVKDVLILERKNLVYVVCVTDRLVFLKYSGK